MANRTVFHQSVTADLAEALDYYEQTSPVLADQFRDSVDRRLNAIAERPEVFPVDLPPIQFAKVHRFPYLIFFVLKPQFVYVVAIVHGASDPGRWRHRE